MINGELCFGKYRPSAMFKVTGEDACTYLQGQFANDLHQPVGSVIYGVWLNQKGRVLADSFALRLAEQEFLLVSLTSAADLLRQRLEKYIIADDVALQDETGKIHGLTIFGAGSSEGARILGGAVPPRGQFLAANECLIFAGRRSDAENFEILGPAPRMAELAAHLRKINGTEVGAEEIEFLRIHSGIPAVPLDVGPGDLPHEGGLEHSAVSYAKGCYLGQEVMARLKGMGQIRRRLFVVTGPAAQLRPQAPLYQAEKKVGEIRTAANRGGESVALAMLALLPLDRAAGLSTGPDQPATLRILARE